MNDINTESLVKRVKNGDKSAADELFRQYCEPLTKFVIKQGLSEFDAQDVVSDTFEEIIKHIDQLNDPSSFSSWIHTIAKRKAWEFKEKSARRQELSAGTEEYDVSNDSDQAIEFAYAQAHADTVMLPEDYAENEDLKQIIAEQINALGIEYKEALYLFYYKDKSIAEIAELTGTNPNNVKQRLFAARKKLKSSLEKLQRSGVVLCAVPFTRFIASYEKYFKNAVRAGSAASYAASNTILKSSAVKSAASVSKTGIGIKVAGIVIAAAVVIGGGVLLLNSSKKQDTGDSGKDSRQEIVREASESDSIQPKDNTNETNTASETGKTNTAYAPTQKIKDAAFTSGYIQIGNDVFKEGGYMTVGEFVKNYSDRWDCSGIDMAAKATEKFFHFFKIAEKGTEISMEIVATAPAAGSGTVADAVIMCFKTEGGMASKMSWLPGGICHKCIDQNYSSMVAMVEQMGYSKSDDLFNKGRSVTASKMQSNVGKYVAKEKSNGNTNDSVYFLVQLDEVNLYGVKPVIGYYFLDAKDGDHVYFHPNWIYYGKKDVYTWS